MWRYRKSFTRSCSVIIKRCLAEGKTVEETASLLQHPVAFIRQCCDEMEK